MGADNQGIERFKSFATRQRLLVYT
jgi:hypothetical protein